MNTPPTSERVITSSPQNANQNIRILTEHRIRYYARHPGEIDVRLAELDEEWDVERVLEANASTLALSGVVLGMTVSKKFLWLSAGVLGFLCQHALKGWCPPLPVLRRMGVRTQNEIGYERYALKCLRGDFDTTAKDRKNVEEVLSAAMPPALEP